MNTVLELPDTMPAICKVGKKEVSNYLKKLIAVELYREGLVSLGKASNIAGIEKIDMMDLLREKKISLQYGVEELEEDLKTLKTIE